jgi:hypothetical protein
MIFFKIPDAVAREQQTGNSAKTLVSPNKTYMLFNKEEVRVTSTAREIHLFPIVTIQRNKDVFISLEIPVRNDSTTWGGLYCNTSVKVNDTTWYDLGNPGYCSPIMNDKTGSTGRVIISKLLDFVPNIGVNADEDYTVQFMISGKSYNGDTWVNKGCDVNAANKGAKGDKLESLTLQNYMRLIIQEVG